MTDFLTRKSQLQSLFSAVADGQGEDALGLEAELNLVAADLCDRVRQVCSRVCRHYWRISGRATRNAELNIDIDRFNYFSRDDVHPFGRVDRGRNHHELNAHISAAGAGISGFHKLTILRALLPESLLMSYREAESILSFAEITHRFRADLHTYEALQEEMNGRDLKGLPLYDADQDPRMDKRYEYTLRDKLDSSANCTREEMDAVFEMLPDLLVLRHLAETRLSAMPQADLKVVGQMISIIDNEMKRLFVRLDKLNECGSRMGAVLLRSEL